MKTSTLFILAFAGYFLTFSNHGFAGNEDTQANNSRFSKVNSYLLTMHKNDQYTEDFLFYLTYLENSDSIYHLDTVAKVYLAQGYNKRAIELYQKRVLPWAKLESMETQNSFNQYYAKLLSAKSKPKISKIKKPSVFKPVENRNKAFGKVRK